LAYATGDRGYYLRKDIYPGDYNINDLPEE
jgi:hypothetical protein